MGERWIGPACLACALLGCVSDPPPSAPPGPPVPTPPKSTLDLEGVYLRTGTWDVSGPLDYEPEFGDRLADLTTEIVIDALGPPDFLEGIARDTFDFLFHELIEDYANDAFPSEVFPGEQFRDNLEEALREVEVEASFELVLRNEDRPNDLSGEGTITTLRMRRGDTELVTTEPIRIGAHVTITEQTRGVLGFGFELEYGALVQAVADELLGIEDIEAHAALLAETFDCDALADDVLDEAMSIADAIGDDNIIDYLDQVSVVILAGCADVRGGVAETIVPLLDVSTPISESGQARFDDENGDEVVDRIVVTPGPVQYFHGLMTLPGQTERLEFPATATVVRLVE